jgi:carbamoyltransferase
MNILGISAFYHDSAACLIKDGNITAAAQEERFSRIKHDHQFPKQAINFCLDYTKLEPKDIDYVTFYDKPWLKFERILETYLTFAPSGIQSFIKAMPLWLKQKLWLKDIIQKKLSGFKGEILFPEHHLSHAASAFYPSPFKKAAFLTTDGVGEWATTSYGVGDGNKLKILSEIHFPHSLGLLYSAFTYYCGFKVNSGEYKLMGLAPYGQPKYTQLIFDNLIDLKGDGSFKLNLKYFNYCTGLTMTSKHFHQLFNRVPRKPESKPAQLDMDLAASIQVVTEEVVMRMAKHIKKTTKQNYLVLAGGVALNCVSNGKLLRSKLFKDIWIQPAAGDAGGALGAALLTWHQHLNKSRKINEKKDSMKGAYLGPDYDDKVIKNFLDKNKLNYQKINRSNLPQAVAKLINHQKVIGLYGGRMEFGPRALGNRSILGDARSPKMQKTINLKIKFRESFRPFAPSVLEEKASQIFNLDRPSPYMLLVADVNKKQLKTLSVKQKNSTGLDKLKAIRSSVPAITHVNNSARIQTVNQKTNPRYHSIIKAFDKLSGCPVIINTSFNVRGEPIVCTPEDAYACFMRTDMDYLLLGSFLLNKSKQGRLKESIDWRQQFKLD